MFLSAFIVRAEGTVRSGAVWPDNRGQHINAHGGGILYHDGRYYWFGEHKSAETTAALVGITCYSSENLTDWRYEGVALPVTDTAGDELERGCIMERPKVVYNASTRKFVLWFHLEFKGQGYGAARYGVAVSDHPTGPYRFLRSGRVNAGVQPLNMKGSMADLDTLDAWKNAEWWTPQWRRAVEDGLFMRRDFDGGQMARDQTVFVDTDGRAYHIFSSEENLTLQIAELSPDYTAHTGRYIRVAPGGQNEAPTVFRHGDTYWMVTSGCTGWAPNKARLFSAPSIWGPWRQHDNPCRGKDADTTFGGQGTYILSTPKGHIFMADIWRPKQPDDSRYIWLPITFEDGLPVIQWRDEWTF